MSPKKANPFVPKTHTSRRLGEFFAGKNFVQIAKICGKITNSTVAECIKGNFPPAYEMLQYIAENGGDVNYILTGVRKNNDFNTKKIDDNLLREVVENWSELTDHEQAKIAGDVRSYKNSKKNNNRKLQKVS